MTIHIDHRGAKLNDGALIGQITAMGHTSFRTQQLLILRLRLHLLHSKV